MIVYTGKQFGNNFNNGDEGLFQDADWPRDNDKFKLSPGINTGKYDLRTANSGIGAQGTYYALKLQQGQSYIIFNTAYFQNEYTADDLSFVTGFKNDTGGTYNAATVAPGLKSEVKGKPYVNPDNGDILIGKSGIYAVTAQCMYVSPQSYHSKIISSTFSSSSAYYKFYVALIVNGQLSMQTQGRGCGGQDTYSVFYLGWFDTGDRVNVGFLHTATSDTFLCHPSISLYRLS